MAGSGLSPPPRGPGGDASGNRTSRVRSIRCSRHRPLPCSRPPLPPTSVGAPPPRTAGFRYPGLATRRAPSENRLCLSDPPVILHPIARQQGGSLLSTPFAVAAVTLLLLVLALLLVLLRRTAPGSNGLDRRLEALEAAYERQNRLSRDDDARARDEAARHARELREEVSGSVLGLNQALVASVGELATAQQRELSTVALQLTALTEATEQRLSEIRAALDAALRRLQEDNAAKLEEMRQHRGRAAPGHPGATTGRVVPPGERAAGGGPPRAGRDAEPGRRRGRPETGADQRQDPGHLGRGPARRPAWSNC